MGDDRFGAPSVSCISCLSHRFPPRCSGCACVRGCGARCPGASRLRGAVPGRVAADARWTGCARSICKYARANTRTNTCHANARSGRDSCGNVHASRAAAVTAVTTHGCQLYMCVTYPYCVSRHAHAFARQLGMPGKPAISQPGSKSPNGECSLPWLRRVNDPCVQEAPLGMAPPWTCRKGTSVPARARAVY